MSYTLHWEPDGVLIRFAGAVTIHDLLEASTAYEADHRFDTLHYVIADYTAITDCLATPDEIDDLWAIDRAASLTNRSIRKAIITTRPEVLALMRRYASAPDLAFPVRSFATLDDGRRWLKIPMARLGEPGVEVFPDPPLSPAPCGTGA